jgi:beta-lactamase class A
MEESSMNRRIIAILLIAIFIPLCAAGSDPALLRLEREIKRLSSLTDGVVGAAATHLETRRKISLHGSERFPMASTFKVPIAVQLLTLVDQGRLQLDQMVTLKASDLHPGSGTLSDLFNKPGLALSIRNLLELMMLISDNSATDVVLRLAGGPQEVTARIRTLGIEGVRVDRSTAQLIADWSGLATLPPESEWTPELFRRLFSTVSPEERRAAARRSEEDPRDTATPEGMALLLERIHRKDLLQKESAELLLDIMLRCRTGETRLKGILPAGTEVAHKTGTIGGTTNDVGIITLPDDAGRVAIAVFVKSAARETAVRERAIAEISRAIHDFFLFLPKPEEDANKERGGPGKRL